MSSKRRVRIAMTWEVALSTDLDGAPFSRLADFEAHARAHLVAPLTFYNPALHVSGVARDHGHTAKLRLTWDIDLDQAPGTWRTVRDNTDLAKRVLIDGIPLFGRFLTVTDLTDIDAATPPVRGGRSLGSAFGQGLFQSRPKGRAWLSVLARGFAARASR